MNLLTHAQRMKLLDDANYILRKWYIDSKQYELAIIGIQKDFNNSTTGTLFTTFIAADIEDDNSQRVLRLFIKFCWKTFNVITYRFHFSSEEVE